MLQVSLMSGHCDPPSFHLCNFESPLGLRSDLPLWVDHHLRGRDPIRIRFTSRDHVWKQLYIHFECSAPIKCKLDTKSIDSCKTVTKQTIKSIMLTFVSWWICSLLIKLTVIVSNANEIKCNWGWLILEKTLNNLVNVYSLEIGS